jgi:hypothetical protein
MTDHLSSSSSTNVPYSQQALINDVRRLHDAWDACRRTRARDAIYDFLTDVYNLAALWKADGKVKGRVRTALMLRGINTSRAAEPFAGLITAAVHPSALDRRTVSKWSRLLCYADAVKLPSEPLRDFVQRKGGINACASRYTQRESRRHANGRDLRGGGGDRRRVHR